MVAYNFNRDFIGPVRTGEKTLTLRKPRSGRSRHARVGGRVQLTTWNTCTKTTSQLMERPCILRATVVLGPEGVVRVLDPATDKSPRAEGLAMLLAQAEQGAPEAARWGDALARLDGFSCYAAMYAWHAADEKAAPGARLTRELIGWGVDA